MSDLAGWSLHGPVHTLRTGHAEWDLSLEQWRAAQQFTMARFRRDGRLGGIEYHNPDGSVPRSTYVYGPAGQLQESRFDMDEGRTTKTVYHYDESGRLARVVTVDRDGTERETEVYRYGLDGKRTKTWFISTPEPNACYGIDCSEQTYDTTGAPVIAARGAGRQPVDEVLVYDEDHRLVRRMICTRDAADRLVSEEIDLGEQGLFPNFDQALENAPPGARESARAMLAEVFGPGNVLSSTTYAYDEYGRLLERRTLMGNLGGHRTTYRYDDRGNLSGETSEHHSREMRIDGEGNIHPAKETSHTQHVRFEYRHDAQENWTERVAWIRLEPNPDFGRSNLVRREITYYAAE